MLYLDFLQRVQELRRPSSYLEIGVDAGESLALATPPAVGIDPAYHLEVEVPADATLYRGTSDAYFASGAIERDLPDGRIALAFIDGMHLFEYVLRDFVNIEAHCTSRSVVVVDDVLPRSHAEAARHRTTADWTGDVWKIIPALARHRPDLTVVPIATQQSGVLLILGLDPRSRELSSRFDEIVAQFRDVTDVPAEILDRVRAAAPEDVLTAPFWGDLRLPAPPDGSPADVPASVREWVPPRFLDPEEVEASKASPWRDVPWEQAGAWRSTRRRVRRSMERLGYRR